ncbi:DUF885 domain-containing protein [Sphingomonas sp. SM33]|uniref:DUF885 domain-containing protein n=1 Tax=Sphingomonas telluris TaxID=2907998 RepID=A0ABS9VNR1_9SPHN|nr:DUF885 domain-containing protein [Sphingomonas telluris]MCH8616621.1 DUF885 domain-containing protein [Sphingomonas telluris]
MDDATGEAIALALVGIDKVWAEVRRTPWVERDLGLPVDRLPDIGEAAVAARSRRAAEALYALDRANEAFLPRELKLTHTVARLTAARMAAEADRYWLAFDPLGIGFFAMFAPTAYCGGFLLGHVGGMLAKFAFETEGDLHRYLGLLEDYARLIDQLRERTAGQARRGIRIPRPQLEQSRELVSRFRRGVTALVPSSDRLQGAGSDRAADLIRERLDRAVDPAFETLLSLLSEADYDARAPETVGIAQYPGGEALYRELVHEHTTLDVSPEQVHAQGLEQVAAVRAAMAELIREVPFEGSPSDYLAATGRDPAWRAQSSEEIEAFFNRYIERIAPLLDDVFRFKPNAPHAAAPLPEMLAGSMTFGYYDAPGPNQPAGRYLFNATNLAGGPLGNIASLNYHELVPGHHFHLASQRENEALHPVRANALFNAFNEGWAEYAATLAGELGMYQAPEERFGRLMMDAFLACRLVVDTGMNAMGWSLEEARTFMRENAFVPETEIRSESIRYSCDIPGQSLAYKIGEHFLTARREEMRARLGERFDLRDFHDAVLKPGALPLPLVAENIASATEQLVA